MKKCKKCNSKLNGKMIFFPKLCLNCVADLIAEGKINEQKVD